MSGIRDIQHSLAVGRKMKEYAIKLDLGTDVAEEYFTIGLLHNIGREFSDNPDYHREIGGFALKRMEYKYWREIFYLGVPDAMYKSQALRCLNLADMTTGQGGKTITMEEKLVDLALRFGASSEAFRKTSAMVKEIKSYEKNFGMPLNELMFVNYPQPNALSV